VNSLLAIYPDAVPQQVKLRCDNGPQYALHASKDSMDVLGLRLERIP